MDWSAAAQQPIVEDEAPPPAKADPMDPAPLVKLLASYVSEIDKMDAQAAAHEVTDDKSNQQAVEMTNQAKKMVQVINRKHKELKAPYLNVTAALDAFRKKLVDRLANTQVIVNDKIRPYLQMLDRKRRAAEKKAREAAAAEQRRLDAIAAAERERLAAEARAKAEAEGKAKAEAEAAAAEAAALVEAPPVVVTEVPIETKTTTDAGTAKLKTDWTWEIEDVKRIPDAAFEARAEEIKKALAPWINAQVKAGARNIEGVRIFQQTKLDTRTRR